MTEGENIPRFVITNGSILQWRWRGPKKRIRYIEPLKGRHREVRRYILCIDRREEKDNRKERCKVKYSDYESHSYESRPRCRRAGPPAAKKNCEGDAARIVLDRNNTKL
jgi:hypothetical protein